MSKTDKTEQFVVDADGRKTAVVIPIGRFERLMEDIHDLAIVAERRNEKAISFDAMKKRLKKNGLL